MGVFLLLGFNHAGYDPEGDMKDAVGDQYDSISDGWPEGWVGLAPAPTLEAAC